MKSTLGFFLLLATITPVLAIETGEVLKKNLVGVYGSHSVGTGRFSILVLKNDGKFEESNWSEEHSNQFFSGSWAVSVEGDAILDYFSKPVRLRAFSGSLLLSEQTGDIFSLHDKGAFEFKVTDVDNRSFRFYAEEKSGGEVYSREVILEFKDRTPTHKRKIRNLTSGKVIVDTTQTANPFNVFTMQGRSAISFEIEERRHLAILVNGGKTLLLQGFGYPLQLE